LAGIAVVLSAIALAEGSLRSSTVLHYEILHSGLRAPMAFFDSTPIGRILNRFSKDVDVVDSQLPRSLHSWIGCAFAVVSALFVICYSTPMFLIVVIPMGVIYYLVQVFPLAISLHSNFLVVETSCITIAF
jgi:ATP-binding cassette, subfamily C (CFTR/MRP), member 1